MAKLFIVGVKDFQMSSELRSFLNEFPVSGIALFNSPFDSPDNIWNDREGSLEAVYEFNQKVLREVDFISADQEGGRVRRLRGAFLNLPSAQKFAETCESAEEKSLASRIYEIAAQQMITAGVRLNFAPVCDMRFEGSSNVVGDRSYGTKPSVIKEWVSLFCDSFRRKGMATTLKHFPGHGPTRFDSHEKVAVIDKEKRDYLKEDAQIFFDLMEKADFLMPGHLALAEHPDRIFSMDSKLLEEFLKSSPARLPMVTDDLLSMKAVSEIKPWLRAFDIGYQYILLCGNLNEAFHSIEETIRHAELTQTTFQQQQALEMRAKKSSDLLKTHWKPIEFSKWRSQILDLESKGQDLLNQLGVNLNA